jgi:hypothetical protein
MPDSVGAGIHWQVAQATSLQNIVFDMHDPSPTNKQQGIFMDNGSGGFFSDLTFNGGNMGAVSLSVATNVGNDTNALYSSLGASSSPLAT